MSSLRVALDATAMPRDRGGVGRYVEQIAASLTELGVNLTVICKREDESVFASAGASTIVAPNAVRGAVHRFVWEQIRLPRLIRAHRFDVLHSPHYTFPLMLRSPRVVTLHDLTFFTMPSLHSAVKRTFFRWWIRRASRTRLAVIVPSRATANDFVSIVGARSDRVTVAYHGYDSDTFHPPTDTELELLQQEIEHLPESWIAFLGTLEPRKNVAALVEAYETVAGSRANPPALLLAGGPGWDPAVVPSVRRAIDHGHDVRILGYVALSSLAAFLGGSRVFAYPSLGEGFGLPVLEAMASGGCVLTTRLTAIPEIGGEAVEYSGTSAQDIASAMTRLLDDPAYADRLRKAGHERASHFTWREAALRHRESYESAGRS